MPRSRFTRKQPIETSAVNLDLLAASENREQNSNEHMEVDGDFSARVLGDAIEQLSSTDYVIGRTVTVFNDSVDGLQQKISEIEKGILKYDEIRSDLENLKHSISALEELRKPIRDVEEFLKDKIEFVMTAVETKGRFNVMDNELASLQKRLSHLEDMISKSKDRNISVWAVMLSLVAILVSIGIAIFYPS